MAQQVASSTRTTDVVIRLVGESGEGTVSLGDLLVQMFTALGLDAYTFQTFPAEIKGGTVMYQLRARSGTILSQGDQVDILVALNDEGFDLFGDGLREGGILLYDSDVFTPQPVEGRTDLPLPVSMLAKEEKDAVRQIVDPEALKRLPPPKNLIGLGALLQLVGAPLEPAEQKIRDLFGRKGDAIVRMNISALHRGAEAVADRAGVSAVPAVRPVQRSKPSITVTGNQMIAMGAIASGLHFFAGYPITPASEILEFLARELPAFGGDVVQAEDEMAAIGMCLGASFSGRKAMTATSGPGVSLMVEQINLASQAELPLVLVDVQRGGASTGMPTKTSQGDLNLALYGVHNESPRIVLAASSVEDCFWTTIDAVNFAEVYQCPVILLSDQSLATRKSTVSPPDLASVRLMARVVPDAEALRGTYHRYLDTPTGISPMASPGTIGGMYTCTGIEHDEYGDPAYSPQNAKRMKDKRFRKLATLLKEHGAEMVRHWGDEGAVDVGLISFGSTEGVIREATERAQAEGIRVGHLHLRMICPLPTAVIEEFASRCRRILVPELNYSGQLAGWIRVHSRIEMETYDRDEGIPFLASEIHEQIVRVAGK